MNHANQLCPTDDKKYDFQFPRCVYESTRSLILFSKKRFKTLTYIRVRGMNTFGKYILLNQNIIKGRKHRGRTSDDPS